MLSSTSTTEAQSGAAGSSANANRNGKLAVVHAYTSPWRWAALQKSANAFRRVSELSEPIARSHTGTSLAVRTHGSSPPSRCWQVGGKTLRGEGVLGAELRDQCI